MAERGLTDGHESEEEILREETLDLLRNITFKTNGQRLHIYTKMTSGEEEHIFIPNYFPNIHSGTNRSRGQNNDGQANIQLLGTSAHDPGETRDCCTSMKSVMHIVLMLVALAGVIFIGFFISSFPAYIVLPAEKFNPMKFVCSPKDKMEIKYGKELQKQKVTHRTICTVSLFNYALLEHNYTYFAVDVTVDLEHVFLKPWSSLFTIKMMYYNQDTSTYNKQRSVYWTVSKCWSPKQEAALCVEDTSYKKNVKFSERVISTVGQNGYGTVTFLFFMDNVKKLMYIYTPIVFLKEVVFLQYYYETKSLSVWFSLADHQKDKYIKAKIRSGSDVTIGDMPNPEVITNSEILHKLSTYPFRYMFGDV